MGMCFAVFWFVGDVPCSGFLFPWIAGEKVSQLDWMDCCFLVSQIVGFTIEWISGHGFWFPRLLKIWF